MTLKIHNGTPEKGNIREKPSFTIIIMVALLGLLSATSRSSVLAPLTPEAAVETTRVIEDYDTLTIGPAPVSISPDHRRALVRLVRGNVKANGVILTILTANLGSSGVVSPFRTIATLQSSGLVAKDSISGPAKDTDSYNERVTWLDSRRVAFIWSDAKGVNQVVELDLGSGRLQFLTHHSTQVMNFAVGSDGSVLYTAQAQHPLSYNRRLLQNGFVVPETADLYGLLHGYVDGTTAHDLYWNSNWFLQRSPTTEPIAIKIDGHDQDFTTYGLLKISPDSRYAIVSAAGFGVPPSWSVYKGEFRNAIADASATRRNFDARMVTSFFVLDMNSLSTTRLWNAPRNLDDVTWAPDSKRVLITGTYLPISDPDEAGRSGKATAVVDVTNGTYEKLPVTIVDGKMHSLWRSNDFIEIQNQSGERTSVETTYLRRSQSWVPVTAPENEHQDTEIQFQLRQSQTTPPAIYAHNQRTGEDRELLDPDPDLSRRFALGDVQYLTGTLSSGDIWQATIYYPTNYIAGQRYPLVIQSDYGTFPTAFFSLYGLRNAGTGPSPVAPSVAQLLANRQFVVVEASVHTKDHEPHSSSEALRNQTTWEVIVSLLDQKGLIDKARVGISGFSRNGYYIEYALTHSSFPWGAAVVDDNYDPSYMTTAVTEWTIENFNSIGAPPFGKGLEMWLREAPGFNVEKIRSPLLQVAQSGGLVSLTWYWEIFSRLEYLHYPVELWAMPDLEHGSHNSQNPRQILAVQHRVIDWFEFWLNGREDPDPNKRDQYARWEQMCNEHGEAHRDLKSYCLHASVQ